MPQPQNPNGAGGRQRLSLSTFFAAALLLAALSVGWGQAAHVIMIRHGAAALPLPLSKYLNEHLEPAIANVNKPDSDVAALRKTARELQARADNPNACAALRAQAADAWQQHQQAAAGHYFDIDALTDQPPPFDNFPRQHDQAVLYVAPYLHKYKPQLAAELLKLQSPDLLPPQLDQPTADRLGRAALDKFGTLPWQISQRVSQLEQSFRSRNLDALPTELAVLAHFVADLHQPLHVTDNHDGKYTGNVGIHRCFEIDIINRYHEHFETATAQAVGRYQYIDDPLEAVFAAIARNYQLLPVIFDADSAARRQSGLTDQDVIYLKSLPFATGDALMLRTDFENMTAQQRRIVRHAELLHQHLLDAADPASERLAQAATMFASLVYTAWINADRPSLTPSSSPANPQPHHTQDYVRTFLIIAAMMLLLLTLARRLNARRRPRA